MSHFYGQMPFVLECGDLISQQWSLKEQLKLLRHESYEVWEERPPRRAIELKGYSRFTHPAIGQAKGHSFMAADAPASLSEESVLKGLWSSIRMLC